jgi:hypothetical protein
MRKYLRARDWEAALPAAIMKMVDKVTRDNFLFKLTNPAKVAPTNPPVFSMHS